MTRRLIALGLLLALAGCGKAGSPVVPNSAFPHPYPNPKLGPTQTVKPAPPEDQPGLQGGDKAKFTDKGSYIDPSVRATELQRNSVAPGSALPYSQTTSPDSNTPFNQSLGMPTQSPLGTYPNPAPLPDEPPPQ